MSDAVRLRHLYPSASELLHDGGGASTWHPRPQPEDPGPLFPLVLGHGQVAGVSEQAPLVLPLGGGVAVRAAKPIAAAILRALAVQILLRCTPDSIQLTGDAEDLGLGGLSPLRSQRGQSQWRLALCLHSEEKYDGDAVLLRLAQEQTVPASIRLVIDCEDPAAALLWAVLPGASGSRSARRAPIRIDALSHSQVTGEEFPLRARRRAATVFGPITASLPIVTTVRSAA